MAVLGAVALVCMAAIALFLQEPGPLLRLEAAERRGGRPFKLESSLSAARATSSGNTTTVVEGSLKRAVESAIASRSLQQVGAPLMRQFWRSLHTSATHRPARPPRPRRLPARLRRKTSRWAAT